jgi:hypothetical protein
MQKFEQVRAYFATHGMSPDAFDEVFTGNGSKLRWLIGALVFTRGTAALDGKPVQPPAELKDQLDAESRATFGVPVAELTVDTIANSPRLSPDYAQAPGTRYAVACGDQPTRSADWYRHLSDQQGPLDPLDGWAYGLGEPCAFWSDAPQHDLPTLPAQVAKNVLVVQGEFDPQTQYEQAKAAAHSARVPLVSVDDSPFHGQYALSGDPCVDGLVNTFLTKNSRPGDTTCPGVPLPGENEVHPVAGPVSGPHGGVGTLVGDTVSTLRQQVQDVIGNINKQR